MGCTSEKYIHESHFNKNQKYNNTDDNIEIDLHDIEKQGEGKHPQKEININDEDQPESNYYNYNLKDLTLVNDSKMTVKRIDNFDDDDDEEESESDSNNEENNAQNIKEENNNTDNFDDNNKNVEEKIKQDENININEEKENQKIKIQEDIDKMPEDKKPPNIKKLRKKGKDKKEINIF